METITVAAAVIEYGGRYMLLKRAPEKENGGLWEFPGGKLQAGESLQAALEREIREELGVNSSVSAVLGAAEMIQGDRVIRLYGLKTVLESEPKALKDHSEFQWVSPDEFSRFPMTEAELRLIHDLRGQFARHVEFASIDVWSCAKLYGVLYAIIGIFMGVFMFFTTMLLPGPLSVTGRAAAAIALPFFNLVAGGIMGAILAALYNVFASFIGGIKVRLK